jgi:hypothetical protein
MHVSMEMMRRATQRIVRKYQAKAMKAFSTEGEAQKRRGEWNNASAILPEK